MKLINISIADDHPVVRRGIVSMLSTCNDIQVIGEATDGYVTMEMLGRGLPDVLIIDLKMPGCSGINLITQIKKKYPCLKIIVLTVYDNDEYVHEAIEAGVDAYLLKCVAHEELARTVRLVHGGGKSLDNSLVGHLLDRQYHVGKGNREQLLNHIEIRILELAADGLTNAEISKQCHYSEITVKQKFQIIFEKLNVRSKTQAVAEAIRRGLV